MLVQIVLSLLCHSRIRNVSKLGCVTVQEILLKDEELPTVVNVVEFGQAGVLRVSAPPPYDCTL